jgi:hypothetical protein
LESASGGCGTDQTKRRWTRRARHGDPGEDSATPERVYLFFLIALGAMVGAIYAAVRLRPAWFSALTCYDLALLSVWLFVVAANGNRLRRAKR